MIKELDLQLTNKCILKCKHCCCSSDFSQPLGHPIERWIDIVKDAKELGVEKIDITGGEPLLFKDLHKLTDTINNLRMSYEIQSTWLINNKISSSHDHTYFISIDGLKKNHDYYRGQGRFDKAIIKLKEIILKQSSETRITTIVTKRNHEDIEKILKLSGSLGVNHHAFFCFSPIGRGANIQEDWIKPLDHISIYNRIFKYISNANCKMPNKISFQLGYSERNGPWKDKIQCRAMENEFLFVLADGRVVPCSWYINTGVSLGNVFNVGLAEVFANSIQFLNGLKSRSKESCSECINWKVCQGGCDAAKLIHRKPIDPRCQNPAEYFPGCPEKKVNFF
ncbi:MAG: radical SAM protein [Candidatus Heimdallarchaeota archaeon]|nr:radical SAM protein [Candidatus Heimdallarchaeota archaeon]